MGLDSREPATQNLTHNTRLRFTGSMASDLFEERYLSAREVADLLRITTKSLARMRAQGRGPRGSFHVSATLVLYPARSVAAFLNACFAGEHSSSENTGGTN